jgi:DNA-binding beta-propeller fold protein YncE
LLGPLAFDPAGNLYIGDAYNHRVRRVDVRGFIDTVDYGGGPQGVAVDAKGNLYVAGGWGMLHRLAPDGRVTPLAGDDCGHLSPGLCVPEGIAVDSLGNVYVADGFCRIRLVTPEGAIKTVAGRETPDGHGWAYTCGYTGDGPAPTSALAWPFAVALDAAGNLLIADTGNHCIRKVDAERMLTTIVGTCGGAGGFGGDGGPARDALLNAPHGVAVDAAGNIYIADTENHRVRMVNVEGVISTIAGNGVRKCRTVSVWAIEACDAP